MARSIQTVQQPKCPGLVDSRFDVIAHGRKVGEVIKNKHGIWSGYRNTAPAPLTYEEVIARRESRSDGYVWGSSGRRKSDALASLLLAAGIPQAPAATAAAIERFRKTETWRNR